jgi:signal transduction histidine kinase
MRFRCRPPCACIAPQWLTSGPFSARLRAAHTSHDLRTPCHGAQCASQLLAARDSVASDNEALYLLNAVRASCSLMLSTINNVLDLRVLEQPDAPARVTAGRRLLQERQRLNPRALFSDVLDVCRVACCKDITWSNEGDAIAEELEARAALRRHVVLLRPE